MKKSTKKEIKEVLLGNVNLFNQAFFVGLGLTCGFCLAIGIWSLIF